jgi:hypothetical protein
LHDLARMKVK